MSPSTRRFPSGFAWGAATASYQIEGAVDADGRGRSIWDRFSHTPGRTAAGETGDVACDHYHRWREDLELLTRLGVGTYRFSVAWPRVIPDGDGPVNPRGLDFYDRLVDELLARGIAPAVTLYHWDLPQALEDRGGWTVRATAEAFAGYAEAVAGRLGDRVPTWITLNEPWVAAMAGYGFGRHAPGRTSLREALLASHHLLLAHARAMPVLRGITGAAGITLNLSPMTPASDAAADAEAAQLADEQLNGWFLDPLLRGRYPAGMTRVYGAAAEGIVADGDLEAIAAPIDFLGVNYYHPTRVAAGVAPDADGELAAALPYHPVLPPGAPLTAMGWPVEPDGLRVLLLRLAEEHPGLPILVTENGSAWEDHVAADGSVTDPERVAYLEGHVAALHEAIAGGADVRAYHAWSLLDNFEWAEGYAKRFGLVHVDYATQRRTPKASFRRYAEIIAANGL